MMRERAGVTSYSAIAWLNNGDKRVTAIAPVRDGVVVFGADFHFTLRCPKRSRLARLRRYLKH